MEFKAKFIGKSGILKEVTIKANSLKQAKKLATIESKKFEGVQDINLCQGNDCIAYKEATWTDRVVFSDYLIMQAEVEYRLKYDNDEGLTEDEIREDIYSSDHVYNEQWNDFYFLVGERLQKIASTGYIAIEGNNIGWRGLSSDDILSLYGTPLEQGKDLLQKIICDSDCTITAFFHSNKTMTINITHHDNPVNGDNFNIYGISERQFDKLNVNY